MAHGTLSWEPWYSERCVRCRSLLGALVPRIVYVTVRSWEPWCYELVTSPFAVGSLGVKSFLCYRSLFYFASLGLLGGPLGALLDCIEALLGRLGALWGRLGASWRPLAVLGLS